MINSPFVIVLKSISYKYSFMCYLRYCFNHIQITAGIQGYIPIESILQNTMLMTVTKY